MKITGTKKLLLILLSLGFTAAAGLGVLLGGFSHSAKVYAQSEQHSLPSLDEELIKEFSEDCGISEEELKFYAYSNNGTVEQLYLYYLKDKEAAVDEILQFLYTYSQGVLATSNEDGSSIEEEDWYVAPDEVGSYNFSAHMVGVIDTWDFITSKTFITTEAAYWRQTPFQWGHLELSRTGGVGEISKGSLTSGNYFNGTTVGSSSCTTGIYWDSFWIFDIVWLEEGEAFTFGVNSNKKYTDKYLGAMTSDFFIDEYMSQKTYTIYNATTKLPVTATYAGYFNSSVAVGTRDDNDVASFEPSTVTKKGTRGEYKDEFGSTISPVTTGSNGQKSAKTGNNSTTTRTAINSAFLKWSTADGGLGAENFAIGKHLAQVSADAPSGFYFMGFFKPFVGTETAFSTFRSGLIQATTNANTHLTAYASLSSWTGWSYYMNYGVLVCRTGVSAPEADYGEGVSSDLKSRTVNYTGSAQQFTLKNDWGPGMTTVTLQEWDSNTNSWISAKNVTMGTRATKGAGVQKDTVFTATNAGKYKIIYTPFRNWTDGSKDPIEYLFEIKPMKLTMPSLIQEEGVDQSTNTKFLYATQKELFISLYPVPKDWSTYTTALQQSSYSDNGVLTLSGISQGVYTITVKLKDSVNTAWDDGSTYGTTDDCVFTFQIGPEKIIVPDIIQDSGDIGATRKEVTFNGAIQSMSFMPIYPSQLYITVQELNTGLWLGQAVTDSEVGYIPKNNTLTINAYDAGHYEIKLQVRPEYIFENIKEELTFELIIYEAEIGAPVLDEPGVSGTVKTVEYGGEKVSIVDGIVQDWVATLTFQNANEACITPILNGLGQDSWGDSTLVLSARAAGTYTVTFVCKKNYKWKSGVNPPTYTLEIEKLKIAAPVLVNDGEKDATYTSVKKEIDFNGLGHTFTINLPTLAATKDTPYTKKSSVYIVHTGSAEESWNADGDTVTFEDIKNAGTYTFTITPTNNYCWSDGTSIAKTFTFRIIPINIDALDARASDQFGGGSLEALSFIPNEGIFRQVVTFDGTPKTIIIGNVGATDDRDKYITDADNTFAKEFYLLDENGNYVNNNGNKLYDNMTASEDGGFLTITAIDAGTYRIAVVIRSSNYWWTETMDSRIEYRLVIEAQGIPQPTINRTTSVGKSPAFTSNASEGKYEMSDVYFNLNFLFSADLPEAYRNLVNIADPYFTDYVHNAGLHDVNGAANEALQVTGGIYTDWREGKLSFYAKDQGVYVWTLTITDKNYKWAGTTSLSITFTIKIARSPISGVEMHYVGDVDEAATNGSNGILVDGKTGVKGSDSYATTIVYDAAIFSDKEKQIFFVRTNTASLVETGFSTQFSYSITSTAKQDGYDTSLLKPLDSNKIFNDEGLWLFALDAGTYQITLTPTDNYCWNDNTFTTGSVVFTLKIAKRQLYKPEIMELDDTTLGSAIGSYTTEFNYDYQTLRLYMAQYPQGYAIGSFEYQDKEDRIGNDLEPLRFTPGDVYPINGKGTPDVTIGVDAVKKTLAVQAMSAGEYLLRITVSNENNYEFEPSIDRDKLQYVFNIDKLMVQLPTAYLSTQNLTSAEAAQKKLTNQQVSTYVPGNRENFEKGTGYKVTAEYNGRFHTVYFFGDDVANGDFVFTVTPATADFLTIQPYYTLDNDPSQTADYFMLTAQVVNTYTISLEFKTKDFYWSTDTANSKSEPRTFIFEITKNTIEVPTIDGFANQPLENDSYTASFAYELSASTNNGAKTQSAFLYNVMLGEKVTSATPVPGVYEYSNITVKISALSQNCVYLNVDDSNIATTLKGDISFTTASLGSSGIVIDGGLVTCTYCIELEINPQNSKWKTGNASANKLYYITITKMQVDRPQFDNSNVGDAYNRNVTYTGADWTDALLISKYENALMNYTASSNIAASDITETFANPSTLGYTDKINVKASAPADTYTMTINLRDTDNTEWKTENGKDGGGIDDIVFNFIVDPMKVAKPYIENTTNPTTSVIGYTKTVTYQVDTNGKGIQQYIEIGNFWTNTADPIPAGEADVMRYTVANGTLDATPVYAKTTTDSKGGVTLPYVQGNNTLLVGAMKYNELNNGLLQIYATDAGNYVIRISLTSNAVWADGSSAPIELTLLIKKIEVDDLKIYDDGNGTISGNTKTVMYNFDANGDEVEHKLSLSVYDADIMTYNGVTLTGNVAALLGDIATTVGGKNGYEFTATQTGEYKFELKLLDGTNYRWKYADTDVAYFTLVINKLLLDNPVIYDTYQLSKEQIDPDKRTLTVDFDLREHTILVQSLFENQNNGKYSNLGITKYFTVTDTTPNWSGYVSPTHDNRMLNSYDDMSNITLVEELFEILKTQGFKYDGDYAGKNVANLVNLFTLTAYTPGEYSLEFKVVDSDNIVWKSGTDTITFTLIINKYTHAAPTVEAGDTTSKEYTADELLFKIVNAYNGVEESNGKVIGTVSEKFELISYTGDDTALNDAVANGTLSSLSQNYLSSWFGGTLTLKFTAVGTYVIRVSITDTDNISWSGTKNTYKDFTFIVEPRTLEFEYTFTAKNNNEVQAYFATLTSSDTPSWPLSTQVEITVIIKGLRHNSSGTIDNLVGFSVYYEDPVNDPGVKQGLVDFDTVNTHAWRTAGPLDDGTFILTFVYYEIPYGQGNMAKGSYILHIVQNTDPTDKNANPSNYKFADPAKAFIVDADPAPFKGHEDMLVWSYSRSDWLPGIPNRVIEGIGGNADNRFADLEYKDGVTYTFYVSLNSTGMAGYQGALGATNTDINKALASWQVKWNGTYGGTQAVTNAGNYSVSVTIEALDPDLYAYANYTFTLYYTIKQAKYDLSSLSWDYDGSKAFTYDGKAHSVSVTGLTGSAFTGLTILRYATSGSFTSYATPTPINVSLTAVNGNSMIYAGNYTTVVFFQVSANSNYALPVSTDGDSYAGTFVWSIDWEIERKKIEVDWLETSTSTSNGDTVTKTSPVIAGAYSSMFAYTYELWDTSLSTPAWVPVTSITRKPGETLQYRATAYLKSTPSNGAIDYARNYRFEFLGEINPFEFEIGGDDTFIVNHIEVGGVATNGSTINPIAINNTTATEFEYTGNPFTATNIIDLDTTNGAISKMTITLLYYEASNPTVPLSAAPYEVGSYIVKLKLSYTGTNDDYAFSEAEAKFDIVKAKIKYSDFEWHFNHSDGVDVTEAKLDATGKWINVESGEEISLDYDGKVYEIFLSSDYASTVISFTYAGNSETDAGKYQATLLATIDTAHYEIDANDPIPSTYDWEIEKHFLDLSKVAWDYSVPYEFTVVNGSPKAFKVVLKNLPDYLLDKIEYTTVRVTQQSEDPETGDITNAGTYKTTVSFILDDEGNDLIDRNNYELGSWPATFSKNLTWVINRKELEIPTNDLSWTEFDGIQHNLLKPFGLDVDWNEYFDIDVLFNDKAYDGAALYGGKYYAYDAGKYDFKLKIKTEFNNEVETNIVWAIYTTSGITRTDNDQTVSYTINKKSLVVTGWIKNYESSSVILQNGVDASKFIEYKFYNGDAGAVGNDVDLDTILASAGGDTFSMVPQIKQAYQGNITLTFNSADNEFTTFTTQDIDETNAKAVGDKPYIYGYSIEGEGLHRYTSDELASGETYVIYTGKQVEFKIYNWDSVYSEILTVWNGSLDDLKQTEAGVYSITLILRKDLDTTLYWGLDGNKIDRSSVTLTFEIRYRTLTIPELPESITYDGTTIDVLSKATNATLSELMQQYGDYVTITGNTATDVGEQMLYLAIKDEYGNAVRWEDGSVGAYALPWKITPVLIARPEQDKNKTSVDYDGTAHSAYEFLTGYNAENVPQSIKDLIKYANVTNGQSINAGTVTTVFSLPSDNYAWCDANGNILTDRTSVTIVWTINKKLIDFTEAYWGYLDGDTPVKYDSTKPFVYTISNGSAKYYSLQIFGMPEILKLYATYTTNGIAGNTANAVDTYITRVVFDLSKIDTNNYTIANQLDAGLAEIEWKIVAREFDIPEYDESWAVYDGAIHSIIEMLGLGDDWAEYFNIKVEYKLDEGSQWADYDGDSRLVTEYSNYNLYNFGIYRVTVTLKANEPICVPGKNLIWNGTAPEAFIIEVSERDVVVTGWFEDDEYSYVTFEGDKLPEGIAEKFDYVIYEDGDTSKTPVAPEKVKPSTTYYIELIIKDGANAFNVDYSYGINLKFANGVVNPYEFGKFSFGNQSIIWMPIPVLEKAVVEYNGEKQTFVIKDFETLYKLTDAQRLQLNSNNNLNLDSSVKSFVYLQDANSLTVTAAGEYTAVVRLLGNVYLSWYDSEKYYASADGRTLYEIGSLTPISDTSTLYNNKSYVLTFTVTPKKVPALSREDLETLLGIVVSYDGTEKDVTKESSAIAALEAKYGKIFDYAGNKGTAAELYNLIISLADNSSCSWYNPDEKEEETCKVVEIEGYRLTYMLENGVWKLILAKTDDEGNFVKDSAGNYVEYFNPNGEYKIDVQYQPKFEMEYVSITDALDSEGYADYTSSYNFLMDNGDIVKIDGVEVKYEYVCDADGKPVRYALNSGVYEEDASGGYVLRYVLSLSDGEKEYGYKNIVMEDATEYTYLYSRLVIGGNGAPAPIKGLDGNYITRYLHQMGSTYELREYTVDEFGLFKLDIFTGEPEYTVIESNCQLVDTNTYSIVNGRYVQDNNGSYMLRYMLESDGVSRVQVSSYEKDDNGNYVIDQTRSTVTFINYAPATGEYVIGTDENGGFKVTVNELENGLRYKVDWKIDSSVLAMPEIDETLIKQYTGGTLYAKDVLKGFIPDLMEIVEGGEGVNAGEYTAKIVITTPNSKWDPAVTTENYVYVTWRIDTAKIDLSDAKWIYTDGTNVYEDGNQFVYTRKNGNPVVYWVEIANLPQALKDRVVYTTNGQQGAYAGINVGKYVTSFTFNIDSNFETFEIPETLETTITWNIQRRLLELPEATSVSMVFDSTEHDLLELLGVSEDWNEYYNIDVMYSNGGAFEPYAGVDGNPYVALNSGTYIFTFTIKPGINVSTTVPNVVWLKTSTETEVPDEEEDNEDDETAEETEPEVSAPEAVTFSELIREEAEEEVAEQAVMPVCEEISVSGNEQTVEQTPVKSEAVTALEQVCDTIKKLVCGAEVQTNSFRKFTLRGTL